MEIPTLVLLIAVAELVVAFIVTVWMLSRRNRRVTDELQRRYTEGENTLIERQADAEAPPFRVAEFHLIASELHAGQPPAYRVVRSFALDG